MRRRCSATRGLYETSVARLDGRRLVGKAELGCFMRECDGLWLPLSCEGITGTVSQSMGGFLFGCRHADLQALLHAEPGHKFAGT